MVRAEKKQKPKLMLEHQGPGPLSGSPMHWRCWQTEWADKTLQQRRRIGEPRVIEVPVRTAFEARRQACLEFWPLWDPLSVEVEWIEPAPKARPTSTDRWKGSALRPTNLVTGFQEPPRYEPDPEPAPLASAPPTRYREILRGALHRFASAVAKRTNGSGK